MCKCEHHHCACLAGSCVGAGSEGCQLYAVYIRHLWDLQAPLMHLKQVSKAQKRKIFQICLFQILRPDWSQETYKHRTGTSFGHSQVGMGTQQIYLLVSCALRKIQLLDRELVQLSLGSSPVSSTATLSWFIVFRSWDSTRVISSA